MKFLIKKFIDIIGLNTLLAYVWDIAKVELEKLVKDSASEWDDKALEYADEIIQKIIKEI